MPFGAPHKPAECAGASIIVLGSTRHGGTICADGEHLKHEDGDNVPKKGKLLFYHEIPEECVSMTSFILFAFQRCLLSCIALILTRSP